MKKLLVLLLWSSLAFAQGGTTARDILPANTGQNLGNANQKWNVWGYNIDFWNLFTYRGVPVNFNTFGGAPGAGYCWTSSSSTSAGWVICATGADGQNGVNGTNGTNGAPGAPGYSPNQIMAGCGVVWTSGLTFTVSPCTYLINQAQYSSALGTVTLATADPSLDRIDVIGVDNTGNLFSSSGTPSVNPAPPSIDISSQLQLTFVYIAAGATTPSNITTTDLYHENAEWTCAVSANLNCASTSNPHLGTKDIEATAATTGNFARLTIPSSTIDLATRNNLVFSIRSKAAWASTRSLTLQWYNGTTAKCTPVTLKESNFTFNSSNTTAYQQIVVPLSTFSCSGIPVTRLQFTVSGTGSTIGFYVDDVILQGGVAPPTALAGLVGRKAWNSTTAYSVNDVVLDNGGSWYAIQANINSEPSLSNTNWFSLGATAPFISSTANPAQSGILRMANADKIAFRKADNSADCNFYLDSNNAWVFDPCGNSATELDFVTEATASATTAAAGHSTLFVDTATGFPCGKDSSGNVHCAAGGSGSVTNIATTSPLSGGPITTTGTISLAANGVTSAFSAVVNNRRACSLQVGDGTNTVVTADYSPFKVASCKVPYAAHIVEISLQSDAGTPSVLLQRRRGAATLADLLSGALAAAGTTSTCALTGTSGTCIDGTTSSNSITLSNAALNAGDVIEVKSGTGSTETSTRITIVWTVD